MQNLQLLCAAWEQSLKQEIVRDKTFKRQEIAHLGIEFKMRLFGALSSMAGKQGKVLNLQVAGWLSVVLILWCQGWWKKSHEIAQMPKQERNHSKWQQVWPAAAIVRMVSTVRFKKYLGWKVSSFFWSLEVPSVITPTTKRLNQFPENS